MLCSVPSAALGCGSELQHLHTSSAADPHRGEAPAPDYSTHTHTQQNIVYIVTVCKCMLCMREKGREKLLFYLYPKSDGYI